MNKVFWGIVVLSVAALVGVFVIFNGDSDSSQADTNSQIEDPFELTDADYIDGNQDAAVVLYEYGDFQCPACATFYPLVKQVKEEYDDDQLAFVFRHFPLSSHPNAVPASKAVEAAGKQGKFYEMHDLVYERQTDWSPKSNAESIFVDYAEELNLDVDQFQSDMDSAEIAERIEYTLETGEVAGVNATPTFFINGEQIQSPTSVEAFKRVIDEYLESASTAETSASPETTAQVESSTE